MNFPANLKYTKSHEWVKDLGGGIFEVGLTDFAQSSLGDIVFVNLPQVGDALKAGAAFGDIESVKAVSDINSPVTGAVKEINESLLDTPAAINESPYDSWLIRAEGKCEDGLLSAADYEKIAVEEEH
ncbi:glycine cleavage system H protein [Spirochaetia bacterium]|nr:glycine cleavage system H protein [Spirochaetia bacterium]GHV23192.1 glycine cleavage system H protein [Spirochaetia bacterium]